MRIFISETMQKSIKRNFASKKSKAKEQRKKIG